MKVIIKHLDDGSMKSDIFIHKADLWDGDRILAKVIYRFLKKYRAVYDSKSTWKGIPSSIMPFMSVDEWDQAKEDAAYKEWLDALDEMIFAFNYLGNDYEHNLPIYKEYSAQISKLRKEKKIDLIEFFNDMSPEREIIHRNYFEKLEAHDNKVQKGIDLFAKYFKHFWM